MSKKLIRFDWAIKRLLRNKANFVVLEGFLSELLYDNIKIKQILESESNQDGSLTTETAHYWDCILTDCETIEMFFMQDDVVKNIV